MARKIFRISFEVFCEANSLEQAEDYAQSLVSDEFLSENVVWVDEMTSDYEDLVQHHCSDGTEE